MDLATANAAIDKAIETANGLGIKFCIAVMDSGVNLVAFSRMDRARVGTIDVAMKKVIDLIQNHLVNFSGHFKKMPQRRDSAGAVCNSGMGIFS